MGVVSLRAERQRRRGGIGGKVDPNNESVAKKPVPAEMVSTQNEERRQLLTEVRTALYSEYGSLAATSILDIDARPRLEVAIREIIETRKLSLPGLRQDRLITWALQEVAGFGEVIESLLEDPEVTEIIVNRHDQVWTMSLDGEKKLQPHSFRSQEELISIIYRICDTVGITINEREAVQTAVLDSGERISVSIPPASSHPGLNIRRFVHRSRTAEDQVRDGGISQEILDFLRVAVAGNSNIGLVGPTGSGKTSFLEVLLHLIPEKYRIVLVQDSDEIELPLHLDVLSLLTTESVGWKTQLEHALRRTPHWIVPGEVRGDEALTALQAANTGHSVMTTYHANNARQEAVARFADMCMLAASNITKAELEEQVKAAFDLFILVQRPLSRNYMPTITEVVEVENDGFRQLYRWNHDEARHEQVALPSSGLIDRLRIHTKVPQSWYGEVPPA